VSGGGDPVLKVWDWRAGRWLYDVAIEDAVRPFIIVCRARRKQGYDSDGEPKLPSRRWLARQRRRQAKAAMLIGEVADTTQDGEEVEEAEAEIEAEDGEDENGNEAADVPVVEDATPATPSGEPEELPTPVLVVQKIETLDVSSRLILVFSAVGYAVRSRRFIRRITTASLVRLRCSGLHCRQSPPPCLKGRFSCMPTTLVAPSSHLLP
jgi:tRNA (guanine-N(7)-)-methyltransferase subunit TRM82